MSAHSESAFHQVWNADAYSRDARFVADLGMPLVALLAPKQHEHILDLGCGDGKLTETLVSFGCRVLGVDASADFVQKVRARGLDAQVMDGRSLTFDAQFDAVFSNAALHWMRDPDAVIGGVWRALKPGGRFVAEMGGGRNVAGVVQALTAVLARHDIDAAALNPWYFPAPDEYAARLTRTGFAVEQMELFERPTRLPGHLRDWLLLFAQPFLSALPSEARPQAIEDACALLQPSMLIDGVWTLDYVRLRFKAVKKQ